MIELVQFSQGKIATEDAMVAEFPVVVGDKNPPYLEALDDYVVQYPLGLTGIVPERVEMSVRSAVSNGVARLGERRVVRHLPHVEVRRDIIDENKKNGH